MVTEAGVIVLWATGDTAETCLWASTPPPGLRVLPVAPSLLAEVAGTALARSPVVVVVRRESDAEPVLALGVDEVLCADAVSTAALTLAGRRARARAAGRQARSETAAGGEEWRAVELLAASLNSRVVTPLAVATLSADIVRAAMRSVTELADAYVRDARDRDGRDPRVGARGAPPLAELSCAPSSAEIHATVEELSAALREALSAVAQIHALIAPTARDESRDLLAEVKDFARVVGTVVERFADFRVDVAGERRQMAMSRFDLVHVLSTLVGNAMRAVRDSGERGVITVRARVRADFATIDVGDDGTSMSPASRAFALDPFTTLRSGTDAGRWLRLADEVRRAGAQLLLDPRPASGTTVRLLVPVLPAREAAARSDDESAPSQPDPPSSDAFA